MKVTNITAATIVGLSALMLTGCESEADKQSNINAATRSALNSDDAELKKALADAQAKDPSVKDVYYSVDENGQRQLNIVREVKDPKTGESSMMNDMLPLLGGMAAGMLIANAMSAGGGFNRGYQPSRSYSSQAEYRRKKNYATSGYAGYVRSNTSKGYAKNPSAYKATNVAGRHSGAFSSSSSARSSGYSAGG
ncbi:MAG: integral membrane protein [Caudoviricetes sp.]|nr:MAG: integral membrane protein [Caudoviricetes sp.]